MNTNMRMIALIFLLITPSFAASERRWICIAEDITHTNLFSKPDFKLADAKPEDFVYIIKLTGDNDQIDIKQHKEELQYNFTDCLIYDKTSFQCHEPNNRNSMFYFDYIAERFLYFHNSIGTNIGADYESYMIAGYCSEFD